MCDIQSLAKNCGQNNPPGTKTKLRFIPAEELLAHLPFLATANAGDSITLDGAWTYVPDTGIGYWRELDITTNTGAIETATVGEMGSLSFENTLNFFVNGFGPAEKEFAQKAANCCLVLAIQDRADAANWHIIGRYDDPAQIQEITGGTGLATGDRRGLAYSVKDMTGTVPEVYPDANGFNLTPNP